MSERCFFCGTNCGEDFDCGSLRCRTMWDDQLAELQNYHEGLIRTGCWMALFHRCQRNSWGLNKLERLFYVAKLWICCLFGRKALFTWRYDPVEVATIYSRKTYAGWEAGWIRVGHGIFHNWRYDVLEDSDWNM